MISNSTPPARELSLVRAAQAGDQQAFGRLVEPYRRALTIHGYRMLGSPHDAEDIVQETLLRAWRGLKSYEPRAPLASWLYRIATNASLDELERRPRRPQPVQPYPDSPLDEADAPAYDPAARYALREGLELGLLTAIQQLPGRQRAVLIFRDVLGWTAPEVAQLLDASIPAVNSALQRARATVDADLPVAPHARAAGPNDRALLRRYVEVWERNDVDGLVALLAQDAELRMPPQPSVRGAEAIVAFFSRGCRMGTSVGAVSLRASSANGRPALVMHRRREDGGREPHGLLLLEVGADGAIAGFDAYIKPELVERFAA